MVLDDGLGLNSSPSTPTWRESTQSWRAFEGYIIIINLVHGVLLLMWTGRPPLEGYLLCTLCIRVDHVLLFSPCLLEDVHPPSFGAF